MKVNIHDIAKEAQVSISAVSQILNGREGRFSEETKARVIKVARELNYRPNLLAAGLASRKTMTLGLIIPDIRNPFFFHLAHGIDEFASQLGYTVMQSNSSDNHEKDMRLIQVMNSYQVDGLFYCMAANVSESAFAASYRELKNTEIPFVIVDRYYPVEGINNVPGLDHELGGYLATQHLIELGHQKIACISGPFKLIDAKLRYEGYCRALKEASLEVAHQLIREGDYSKSSSYELTKDLIAKENPTAIFAANDLMALGAMAAVQECGLRVPGDISIVGYDNIFLVDLPDYNLTTVHQPIRELGHVAVASLMEKLGEDCPALAADYLLPRLIERGSTGPVLDGA
ncbi:MAG: LacI family DNA-binding transcriptional regulator, partial [Eubacteriales bacterium]|nr:LacI family DNA-binding transcriptional regulator [Eubacteriales bacterium]